MVESITYELLLHFAYQHLPYVQHTHKQSIPYSHFAQRNEGEMNMTLADILMLGIIFVTVLGMALWFWRYDVKDRKDSRQLWNGVRHFPDLLVAKLNEWVERNKP